MKGQPYLRCYFNNRPMVQPKMIELQTSGEQCELYLKPEAQPTTFAKLDLTDKRAEKYVRHRFAVLCWSALHASSARDDSSCSLACSQPNDDCPSLESTELLIFVTITPCSSDDLLHRNPRLRIVSGAASFLMFQPWQLETFSTSAAGNIGQ